MRRLVFMLAVAATVAAAFVGAPTAALANGCPLRFSQLTAGTADDPIRVGTVADLTTVATYGSCYASGYVFRQTADLDLAGATWTPIGTLLNGFNGTYDGGGHSLRGMSAVGVTAEGLFGNIDGGTIRNLTLIGPVSTSTGDRAGALAGQFGSGTITGITVTGAQVTAHGNAAGGLIGYAGTGTVSDVAVSGTVSVSTVYGAQGGGIVGEVCGNLELSRATSTAAVTASGDGSAAGGAIGTLGSACIGSRRAVARQPRPRIPTIGVIVDVHATGAVTADTYAGGFAGTLNTGSYTRASATGAATAAIAGGFVAQSTGSVIADAYATGRTNGTTSAAFAAQVTGVTLTNVYGSGAVTGTDTAGGLANGLVPVSAPVNSATASFWDTQSTGQAASLLGTARTTAQMQSIGTFSDAGWTIAPGWSAAAARVWGICPIVNGGRPFLVSQYAADPCPTAPGAPRSVTVTPGDGKLTVSWTAPESDGGASVSEYAATATMQKQGAKAAPKCTATAPTATCTIAGLKNGRAYRVTVTATNVAGTGAAGAAASTVTPSRGLVVLSMRRSGHAVVTRVRVSSAGTLTQYGEPTRSNGVACRAATARPKRAGVVTLRCPLDAAAIRTLDAKALRLRIVTRFAPASGRAVTATRLVTFPLAAGAPVVTG